MLFYESISGIAKRLTDTGYSQDVSLEIANSMYATKDIDFIRSRLSIACSQNSIEFISVDFSEESAEETMDFLKRDAGTAVWCVTDGGRYLLSSTISAMCRFNGLAQFGSSTYTQEICQNKFAWTSILHDFGIRVPVSWLARNGRIVGKVGDEEKEITCYFVKPNTLGNKTGITEYSRTNSLDDALNYSKSIWLRYNTDSIIQEYIEGVDGRLLFLNRHKNTHPELGIMLFEPTTNDRHSRFPIMKERMGIATLEQKRDFILVQPGENFRNIDNDTWIAVKKVRQILEQHLSLKDYWGVDLRIQQNGSPVFIETEPGTAVTVPYFVYFAEANGKTWEQSMLSAIEIAYRKFHHWSPRFSEI